MKNIHCAYLFFLTTVVAFLLSGSGCATHDNEFNESLISNINRVGLYDSNQITSSPHASEETLEIEKNESNEKQDNFISNSAVENIVVNNDSRPQENQNKNKALTATVFVENTAYTAFFEKDHKVIDLMRYLAENTNFSFSGVDHGSLGFFVESINGLPNDKQTRKYWIYYINGQKAKTGVSNYAPNNSDIIEWKYESEETW